MINKVERLTSIGKYRNYQASGQVNFKKLTLIYGENGGGKTTLTSILRSLTTNNPEIIKSRISTNHTANQAAQISQSATPNINHTYRSSTGWSSQLPNIEVFDIHFVNENVYAGFDFNEEHKKQLHQFVIGAQGVAIQNQIEQNKTDKANSRQTIAQLEQQLITQVGNNLTASLLSSFLSIPATEANGIDSKITDADTALLSANSNSIIQTLETLLPLNRIATGIDFDSISIDLQSTFQSIQNDSLKNLFSNHCDDLKQNSIEGPENWLQKGFKYIDQKKGTDSESVSCPFCQQSVDDNLDIIKAYTSKFNTEFNDLILRLQSHLRSVQDFNLESALQRINNIKESNSSKYNSWVTHLPNATRPSPENVIADESLFKDRLDQLIEIIEQKIQNPTISISLSAIDNFKAVGQAVNSNIDSYNQGVTALNSIINTFKSGIQTVANAQQEVDRLNRIKARFETPITTLCNQYNTEKQNLRALESTYTQLSQQQQQAATTFFTSYQGRINHYLGNVFKTHFRIEDVSHVAPRGRATQSKIGYKLTIDGNDISFNPNQPFSAKECLSEGDKSTIALALFLSKLDIDPNRQDKILVFDDPLSSLDTNRRTYTIGLIKSLFQDLKQIIVLSHSEYFLHEIGKDFGGANKCTLRITENFSAKESKIEVCDLDELVKIDYFKHIEALEAFRTNPNHAIKDSVLGWLRNVLESHLRFKFYKEVRSMSGMQTFGRLINFIDSQPTIVFRNNSNRANIISSLHLINGVSWRPHHGDPTPDYTVLGMNPTSMTASELDNLILDTLDLIDVQL